MKRHISLIALIVLPQLVSAAAPVTSYMPARGLGELLASRFDLATIRSSMGPRRTAEANTFASLGHRPSNTSDTSVVFDSGDWYYSLTVLRRGDFNKDGIEDLEVCFVDHARPGYATYNSQQALLVTRYAPDGNLLALAYSMQGCERLPAGRSP